MNRIFLILLTLGMVVSGAVASDRLIEAGPYGWIDWEHEKVVMRFPKQGPLIFGAAKEPRDYTAAILKLKSAYISLIQSFRLSNTTTFGEWLDQDPNLKEECLDAFFLGHIQQMEMGSPANPSIQIHIPFYGECGFAKVVFYRLLPATDKPIQTTLRAYLESGKQDPSYLLGKAFTGLIIDARTCNVSPCLTPEILSPSGEKLFSIDQVQFLSLLHSGCVGYRDSLDAAKQDSRVGTNPLIIRAIRASTVFKGNVVLSQADITLIRQANGVTGFLEKGKILFVI